MSSRTMMLLVSLTLVSAAASPSTAEAFTIDRQASTSTQEKKPKDNLSPKPGGPRKTMSAIGTVASVTADSITVKSTTGEWTFSVDNSTKITAKGASTKSSDLKAAGKSPTLTDFVKRGDSVRVSYKDMGATKHAASVTVVTPASKK